MYNIYNNTDLFPFTYDLFRLHKRIIKGKKKWAFQVPNLIIKYKYISKFEYL